MDGVEEPMMVQTAIDNLVMENNNKSLSKPLLEYTPIAIKLIGSVQISYKAKARDRSSSCMALLGQGKLSQPVDTKCTLNIMVTNLSDRICGRVYEEAFT